MDSRLWFSVIVLAVISFVFLWFTGIVGSMVSFFLLNPLLLIALVAFFVAVLAWKSGNGTIALGALGLLLISIGADFYYPPLSFACVAPTNQLASSFVNSYPTSALADDTVICVLWQSVFPNPVLFSFNFPSPLPVPWVVVPTILAIAIILSILAIKLELKKLWLTIFILIFLSAMIAFLFPTMTIDSVSITASFVFAYLVVAPVLLFLGTWLLPFNGK